MKLTDEENDPFWKLSMDYRCKRCRHRLGTHGAAIPHPCHDEFDGKCVCHGFVGPYNKSPDPEWGYPIDMQDAWA